MALDITIMLRLSKDERDKLGIDLEETMKLAADVIEGQRKHLKDARDAFIQERNARKELLQKLGYYTGKKDQ